MNNKDAYNIWAQQYDTNKNLTRDIEGKALKEITGNYRYSKVLEIGCGTGKNTQWLATKAQQVIAVDFSDKMLASAKLKVISSRVKFIEADITNEWLFAQAKFDLITFSLVLEHINDISFIFKQVKENIQPGGYVYVGELHPFKQYTGSQARFEMQDKQVKLDCYLHHISDFIAAASDNGLSLIKLNEWFDDDNKTTIPRLLTLVFKAPSTRC